MGKRSAFPRLAHDLYDTPQKAIDPLLPFLAGVSSFAEPCVGNGVLRQHLTDLGLLCAYQGDIRFGRDALKITAAELAAADIVCTNPPWSRSILHRLIDHFLRLGKPTWLLFDSDWAFTGQAAPYLPHCSAIVSVGRLKWIPGSRHNGKDNCAWFHFLGAHDAGPRFYGKSIKEEAAA